MGSTSSGAWGSTTDSAGIVARLSAARRAVIVTHGKPDGDAVGSTLAVARALALRGAWAEIWYIGPAPRWADLLVGKTPARVFAPAKPAARPKPDDFDTLVCVDTGTWSQLAEFKDWMPSLSARAVLIDHHLHGDPDVAAMRLVETRAASCTQVLAPVLCRLLGRDSAAELPREVAEALYLGLATDTGWFRYSSVTRETMVLGGELLAAGVDHTMLYRVIEQQDEAGRWRLLGRSLSSLELHGNGRYAIQTLRAQDFVDCGATRNDTTGFADMVLAIASVQASAVITEGDDNGSASGPISKISMRTKPGQGAIDANRLMGELGGGGHARAAGAMLAVPVEEAKRKLLELLK